MARTVRRNSRSRQQRRSRSQRRTQRRQSQRQQRRQSQRQSRKQQKRSQSQKRKQSRSQAQRRQSQSRQQRRRGSQKGGMFKAAGKMVAAAGAKMKNAVSTDRKQHKFSLFKIPNDDKLVLMWTGTNKGKNTNKCFVITRVMEPYQNAEWVNSIFIEGDELEESNDKYPKAESITPYPGIVPKNEFVLIKNRVQGTKLLQLFPTTSREDFDKLRFLFIDPEEITPYLQTRFTYKDYTNMMIKDSSDKKKDSASSIIFTLTKGTFRDEPQEKLYLSYSFKKNDIKRTKIYELVNARMEIPSMMSQKDYVTVQVTCTEIKYVKMLYEETVDTEIEKKSIVFLNTSNLTTIKVDGVAEVGEATGGTPVEGGETMGETPDGGSTAKHIITFDVLKNDMTDYYRNQNTSGTQIVENFPRNTNRTVDIVPVTRGANNTTATVISNMGLRGMGRQVKVEEDDV